MKLIKKEQRPKGTLLEKNYEYWDLGNAFIAEVGIYNQENTVHICLCNESNIYILSPAERCIKDEIFARKIQKKIDNIKIDYGIDAVYMVCSKDQLMEVLAEIERHINNQQW